MENSAYELAHRLWTAWLSHRLGLSYAATARRISGAPVPAYWIGRAATIDQEIASLIDARLSNADAGQCRPPVN